MKRQAFVFMLAAALCVSLVALVGCSGSSQTGKPADSAQTSATTIRVSSLKGPTSIGLAGVMKAADNKELSDTYDFQISAAADEIVAKLASGETDIALLPANVAATVYAKTQAISVIDINTLGVLYGVSGDESVNSIADLVGRKVYLSGKGTTPDYVLSYLLSAHGISLDQISLEYKSEPSEVAALLGTDPNAVGILPEPYADSIGLKNPTLQTRIDLTREWEAVQGDGGSKLVTGVTVVRNEFARDNPDAIERFLDNHRASASFVNSHVEEAATIVSEKGIIPEQMIAKAIIPKCNIVYIDGTEMKNALEGYVSVLFAADPKSVGGALPASDFYTLT